MSHATLDQLIQILARLPGLGPRSARRAALFLLKRRQQYMLPLADALRDVAQTVQTCDTCGNLDHRNPCPFCTDPRRDQTAICVIEDIGDLWALERSGAYKGLYHVLGGKLSALDGVGPDQLNLTSLLMRVRTGGVQEVILALSATVEGQTTAHYVAEKLQDESVRITRLGHGVPIGGALDYLDDGTILAALRARRPA